MSNDIKHKPRTEFNCCRRQPTLGYSHIKICSKLNSFCELSFRGQEERRGIVHLSSSSNGEARSANWINEKHYTKVSHGIYHIIASSNSTCYQSLLLSDESIITFFCMQSSHLVQAIFSFWTDVFLYSLLHAPDAPLTKLFLRFREFIHCHCNFSREYNFLSKLFRKSSWQCVNWLWRRSENFSIIIIFLVLF